MKKEVILVSLILVVCGVWFFSPVSYESDFYWYHVLECLDAHEKGFAFSLCSGFYINVSEVKEDGPCLIMPHENPLFVVYHGSIAGSYELAYNRVHYYIILENERKEMVNMIKWWFEEHAHKYDKNPSRRELYKWWANFRGLPSTNEFKT